MMDKKITPKYKLFDDSFTKNIVDIAVGLAKQITISFNDFEETDLMAKYLSILFVKKRIEQTVEIKHKNYKKYLRILEWVAEDLNREID